MTKTRPPKYCIDKSKKKAYVRIDGKKSYLPGRNNSPESREAYARFEIEWWENYRRPVAERIFPAPVDSGTKTDTTVKEVALAFLQYAESTKSPDNFRKYRQATIDFLVKHYGEFPADEFTTNCLHLLRTAMIQSRRLCRDGINDYTRRIVTLFNWGVSVGLVNPMTAWALSTIKPLEPGYPGTFDYPKREYVVDPVIIATLQFLPPTLQAMVKLQRLTGMRPSEVFLMRVGDIDTQSVPGIWLYRLATHKTQKKTGKKRIMPLNATEQALIAPYLIGRKPADSVFSPKTALKEYYPNRKVNSRVGDFYDRYSYRVAVLRAIEKRNRQLPVEQQIPKWTPYELRHSAASAISVELSGEAAMTQLGHTSSTTTAIYLHREIEKLTKLAVAREKHNPFEGGVEFTLPFDTAGEKKAG